MAIDFPNSPTLNQEYTSGTKTWKWDGTVWNLVASGLVGPTGATGSTGANANRNLIINGNFSINQRGYTSGSLIPEGLYCFDRWKNSTFLFTASLTFTSAPQGQQVTISADRSIKQIVERANVVAGQYVLSWEGTARGRVYNSGATPGSYVTSPIIVTLDGLANVEVEFTTLAGVSATLANVQLERGSTPTTFEQRPIGLELALCQRYYQRFLGGTNGLVYGYGYADGAGTAYNATFPLKVTMRATPTIGVIGTVTGFDLLVQRTITAFTSTRGSTEIASGDPSYSGGTFNANRNMIYFSGAGNNGVDFSAEL